MINGLFYHKLRFRYTFLTYFIILYGKILRITGHTSEKKFLCIRISVCYVVNGED